MEVDKGDISQEPTKEEIKLFTLIMIDQAITNSIALGKQKQVQCSQEDEANLFAEVEIVSN